MLKTEVPDIFFFISIYHYIIDIIGQKSAAESISAMNHSHRGQRTPFCDIIRYKSFQAERGLLMAGTFLVLLDEMLYGVVQISTTLLEFFGIAVLMATALKCFYFWLKKNNIPAPDPSAARTGSEAGIFDQRGPYQLIFLSKIISV